MVAADLCIGLIRSLLVKVDSGLAAHSRCAWSRALHMIGSMH